MLDKSKAISPSRRYVAMCYKLNFNGVYFRTFTLPELHMNTAAVACSYFVNHLDITSCVETVFPEEDYRNVREVRLIDGAV
jgi:hypothetical protein